MATMSAAEFQIFARHDFYTFMHRAFRELNPRSPFLHNWHNELIASKLEACRHGEINRLIGQRTTTLPQIPCRRCGLPGFHSRP